MSRVNRPRAVEGLAGGKASCSSEHPSGGKVAPAISSRKRTRRTSVGSQHWARAVAQISRAAHVGPTHAPKEDIELRWQRPSLRCLHLPNSFQAAGPDWTEKVKARVHMPDDRLFRRKTQAPFGQKSLDNGLNLALQSLC